MESNFSNTQLLIRINEKMLIKSSDTIKILWMISTRGEIIIQICMWVKKVFNEKVSMDRSALQSLLVSNIHFIKL